MSAAKAAGDHMRNWFLGTKPGQFVSMGVVSDGSYKIPKDIVYSFPVTIENGQWKIVQGLPIDDFSRKLMDVTAKELQEEREEAESVIKSWLANKLWFVKLEFERLDEEGVIYSQAETKCRKQK